MGCGNCHAFRAGNSEGIHAPDLDAALAGYSREALKAKILDPYGRVPPGTFTVMPTDFGRRMSDAELDALVTFLLIAREPASRTRSEGA
jgi:mono/diheme cytochrome c family protein